MTPRRSRRDGGLTLYVVLSAMVIALLLAMVIVTWLKPSCVTDYQLPTTLGAF